MGFSLFLVPSQEGQHMTPLERQDRALEQNVRSALGQGKVVVVLGWKESNHDDFTRALSQGGKVLFYEESPGSLSQKVGFVIFTKFTGHGTFSRVRTVTPTHPVVLGNGHIKRILESCKDVLETSVVSPVEEEKLSSAIIDPKPAVVASISKFEVQTEVVQVAPEEKKMEDMSGFILAFMKEADRRGGSVGRNTLGNIRRAHGINLSNPDLVRSGWILPIISEGQTGVGSYRASEKMLKEAGRVPETEPVADPTFVQVKAFIARGASLEEQIFQLELQLEELKKELDRVTAAKELLAKLTELTK